MTTGQAEAIDACWNARLVATATRTDVYCVSVDLGLERVPLREGRVVGRPEAVARDASMTDLVRLGEWDLPRGEGGRIVVDSAGTRFVARLRTYDARECFGEWDAASSIDSTCVMWRRAEASFVMPGE